MIVKKLSILIFTFLIITNSTTMAENRGLVNANIDSTATNYKQHYNLLVVNTKVGDFDITKTVSKARVSYDARSLVEISFMGKLSFEYTLHCIYEKGVLSFSEFTLYRNGNLKGKTRIEKTASGYRVTKDDEESVLKNTIYNSAVQLYFEEPTNAKNILSEKEGIVFGTKLFKAHCYELIIPDGDEAIQYFYKNNELNEMIVDLFITEFKMVRD